jgi:hypothetical protein
MEKGYRVAKDIERDNSLKNDSENERMDYIVMNNSDNDTWQEVKRHDRRVNSVRGGKRQVQKVTDSHLENKV